MIPRGREDHASCVRHESLRSKRYIQAAAPSTRGTRTPHQSASRSCVVSTHVPNRVITPSHALVNLMCERARSSANRQQLPSLLVCSAHRHALRRVIRSSLATQPARSNVRASASHLHSSSPPHPRQHHTPPRAPRRAYHTAQQLSLVPHTASLTPPPPHFVIAPPTHRPSVPRRNHSSYHTARKHHALSHAPPSVPTHTVHVRAPRSPSCPHSHVGHTCRRGSRSPNSSKLSLNTTRPAKLSNQLACQLHRSPATYLVPAHSIPIHGGGRVSHAASPIRTALKRLYCLRPRPHSITSLRAQHTCTSRALTLRTSTSTRASSTSLLHPHTS